MQWLQSNPVTVLILCFWIEMINTHTDYSIRTELTFQTVITFQEYTGIKFESTICFPYSCAKIEITFETRYFITAFVGSFFIVTFQYTCVECNAETIPFPRCNAYKNSLA